MNWFGNNQGLWYPASSWGAGTHFGGGREGWDWTWLWGYFGSSLIQTNHSRTCVAVAIYPGWRKTCSIRKTRLSQVQIQEEGNIHAHNFARFPSSSTLTIHATSCKFIQHIRTSFQCRFGLLARQAMNRARCVCIVFSGQGRADAHWTAHQCLHYYIQISNITKISNIHISFDSILYLYITKD